MTKDSSHFYVWSIEEYPTPTTSQFYLSVMPGTRGGNSGAGRDLSGDTLHVYVLSSPQSVATSAGTRGRSHLCKVSDLELGRYRLPSSAIVLPDMEKDQITSHSAVLNVLVLSLVFPGRSE